MTNAEPFVSVVTPFYNTAPFLVECIESVLRQTYSNFEYLLVDNHSTDGGAEIAKEYAAQDSRIRLIEADQFRDQIPNYNYALRQISGDSAYVKIVQADDWLHSACLQEFIDLATANPTVALLSSYDLRGTEVFGTGLSADQRFLSGRDAARLYFLRWLFLFGSQTTVLYRADVVRSRAAFFPEDTMHPDTEVVFEILAANDFGFVHQVLSFTRLRADSISGQLQDMADAAIDRLIIVKRFGERFLERAEYAAVLQSALDWYYDELARRWLSERLGPRNEAFWAYHRRGLATIDETIRRGPLLRAVSRVLLRSVTNPRLMVQRLRGARPLH